MKIYHAGDTNVFGDMKIIHDLYAPEIAMLPIGDHYTMSPREAAYACNLLQAKTVIPMHFGTFPVLTGTAERIAEAGLRTSKSGDEAGRDDLNADLDCRFQIADRLHRRGTRDQKSAICNLKSGIYSLTICNLNDLSQIAESVRAENLQSEIFNLKFKEVCLVHRTQIMPAGAITVS